MSETEQTVQNDDKEAVVIEVGIVENFEVNDPEDDKSLESEVTEVTKKMESATIIQQVKELTATFEKLVKEIKPPVSEDPKQVAHHHPSIDSFYDLYRLWQEQVANLTTIQNMQAEDFEKQLMEKDEVRKKLQADLENQGHAHLIEIEKLKKQFTIELEAKDKICLDLENQIEHQRGEHEDLVSCSICLEPWAQSGYHRLVSLACGHLFGDSCIREFLARQRMCPQCRDFASAADIRYLFGRPA